MARTLFSKIPIPPLFSLSNHLRFFHRFFSLSTSAPSPFVPNFSPFSPSLLFSPRGREVISPLFLSNFFVRVVRVPLASSTRTYNTQTRGCRAVGHPGETSSPSFLPFFLPRSCRRLLRPTVPLFAPSLSLSLFSISGLVDPALRPSYHS